LTDALFRAEKTYHHIDGLILNAGVLDPIGSIGDDTTIASWKDHFDVNFFSLVTALKAALPSLRQSTLGARVIFISSGNSVKGPVGMGPYNASKAAVNSLCRYVDFYQWQGCSLTPLEDSWK
jgi:NAD(P)-dependent dehydrogenase (short-subunit alcohol dehydrogenase family)